jgi:hypothetical protein
MGNNDDPLRKSEASCHRDPGKSEDSGNANDALNQLSREFGSDETPLHETDQPIIDVLFGSVCSVGI